MRKILGALAATALATAGVLAVPATAQAADCTLVQSEIYNGANQISYVQGLDGCAGDVYWEIHSVSGGSHTVWDSGTTYYNDATNTFHGDLEYPCFMRIYASYGTQEKLTNTVQNYNCA